MPGASRNRPVGWGPDFVLGWLRDNPTGRPETLYDQVAPRCPRPVTKAAVRFEVDRWRRQDREFALAFRDLMKAREGIPDGPQTHSKDRTNPDWRQEWALVYLKTRSHSKAAEAVGLDRQTTWRKRKPGHPEFDQEFYDIYSGVLEAIKEHYEDVLHWALEESEIQGDARTAGNLAMTILERVDKGRWTRAEDRTIEQRIDHSVHLTIELSEGAQKAMRHAELLSKKFAKALGPGLEAIDVTPRVVEKVLAHP